MTRFTISAALVAASMAAAAPAFADQLAANAGVEPGVLTDAQLVELATARSNDDSVRVYQILNSINAGTTVSTSN